MDGWDDVPLLFSWLCAICLSRVVRQRLFLDVPLGHLLPVSQSKFILRRMGLTFRFQHIYLYMVQCQWNSYTSAYALNAA